MLTQFDNRYNSDEELHLGNAFVNGIIKVEIENDPLLIEYFSNRDSEWWKTELLYMDEDDKYYWGYDYIVIKKHRCEDQYERKYLSGYFLQSGYYYTIYMDNKWKDVCEIYLGETMPYPSTCYTDKKIRDIILRRRAREYDKLNNR